MSANLNFQEKDEIVYLYVHEWVFGDKQEDKFYGHPKPNKVYQAIKNSNTYRIPLKSKDKHISGLLIGDLEVENHEKWEYKVEEITEHNILDLGIDPAEIIKIGAWEDADNEDIRHLTDEKVENVEEGSEGDSGEEPNGSIGFGERNIKPSIEGFASHYAFDMGASKISYADDDMFNILAKLLVYVSSTYEDKYERDDNPHGLDILKQIGMTEEYGKGALMFCALKYLQRYLSIGNKTNDVRDLYKAIHYILFELQRRNIQNKKQL